MDGNATSQMPVANVDLKGRIWAETKIAWRIILPTVISRVSSLSTAFMTQIWIGHINKVELAAWVNTERPSTVRQRDNCEFPDLRESYVLFGHDNSEPNDFFTICFSKLGMSSATETFCGQAFGAGQYHMMGIYLQRSWIVGVVTTMILTPLFVFAAPIFRALGENGEVADATEQIALLYIPVIYTFTFCLTCQMFLQSQMKSAVIGYICVIGFLLNLLLSWIFVGKLDLGVSGAMGSLIVTWWLMVGMFFTYIFGGWCTDTWIGFSLAAFNDLWPMIKLSVSSGVMLCLELWYQAILVLIAGYVGDARVEISAFSFCMTINALEFMIGLGFLVAACVRVVNELGRGNAEAATFSVKVIMTNSLVIGILFFVLYLVFGKDIPRFLTSDVEVQEAMADLSYLLSISFLFNSIQPVLTGVAVGAGLQGPVAIINVCCYYLIGVPLGLLLGFWADWGIKGLWIGLLLGVVGQTLVLGFLIWRTNWQDQVDKASKRLNQWLLESSTENDEDTVPSS